jgi:broad specificity phosphatase PhoE
MLRATLLSLLLAAPALGPLPAGTMRVFLVRHGQAYSNLDPEPDLPPDQLDRLTDLGRLQSRSAAAFLKDQNVAAIFVSPAGRARETADELRQVLGLNAATIQNALRPLDLGRGPEGAPLGWDQRIAEWEAGRDPSPPGGESLEELGRRVQRLVVDTLWPGHAGQCVVLVAHSEVIAAFLGSLDGKPGARRWPPTARNGSVTVVDVGTSGTRLLLAGHVPETAPQPH